MSLEPEELVTAAEATRETLAKVTGAAASLTSEQEDAIRTELGKYQENKDEVDFAMRGGSKGLYLSPRDLLEEIRQRIRKHFGWSSLSPEMGGVAPAHVGGVSRSGKASVEADSDRAAPAFTRGLFE